MGIRLDDGELGIGIDVYLANLERDVPVLESILAKLGFPKDATLSYTFQDGRAFTHPIRVSTTNSD